MGEGWGGRCVCVLVARKERGVCGWGHKWRLESTYSKDIYITNNYKRAESRAQKGVERTQRPGEQKERADRERECEPQRERECVCVCGVTLLRVAMCIFSWDMTHKTHTWDTLLSTHKTHTWQAVVKTRPETAKTRHPSPKACGWVAGVGAGGKKTISGVQVMHAVRDKKKNDRDKKAKD